jgi:L-proline---[L-prolyl-carrier protein] ligase
MSRDRLDRLVSAASARTPDAVALTAAGRQVRYRDLEADANRVARVLLAHGLRPGDRVGIHARKGCTTVAAMIGVLRAGGVYVPIDPLAPARRAAQLAGDCGLTQLVADADLARAWAAGPGLPAALGTVVLTGAAGDLGLPSAAVVEWATVAAGDGTPPPAPARGPDDLAYILYTSGSTGTPKGVMISHRNALAFVEWAAGAFGLRAADRLASHAPFHFDLSVFDLYAAFMVGARVALIDEIGARAPHRLVSWVEQEGITVWYSVPSALILMMREGGLARGRCTALRRVLFAGEEFPLPQLARLVEALPGSALWNLYGPTETNVCTAFPIAPAALARASALPIGRACSGDRVSIRDAAGNEAPVGQVGEVWVAGPTVMVGYWPTPRPAGDGWYRTGDLASWDADGEIVFHGRRDSMVKIRGYRVELREVEIALAAHPAVREAVVVAVADDGPGGKVLAAYVVSDSTELSVMAVKRHCADRLPAYMVPRHVRVQTELPRTSSGKVDRLALAARAAAAQPPAPSM